MGTAGRHSEIAPKIRSIKFKEKEHQLVSIGSLTIIWNGFLWSGCSDGNIQQSLGLKRLDDILVEKVLLSVQLLGPGTILGLAYSDGTIEFRDRIRLDVVGFDGNLEKVTSLPGIGFAFPSEGPCKSPVVVYYLRCANGSCRLIDLTFSKLLCCRQYRWWRWSSFESNALRSGWD